jgi:hypothetical protein
LARDPAPLALRLDEAFHDVRNRSLFGEAQRLHHSFYRRRGPKVQGYVARLWSGLGHGLAGLLQIGLGTSLAEPHANRNTFNHFVTLSAFALDRTLSAFDCNAVRKRTLTLTNCERPMTARQAEHWLCERLEAAGGEALRITREEFAELLRHELIEYKPTIPGAGRYAGYSPTISGSAIVLAERGV